MKCTIFQLFIVGRNYDGSRLLAAFAVSRTKTKKVNTYTRDKRYCSHVYLCIMWTMLVVMGNAADYLVHFGCREIRWFW